MTTARLDRLALALTCSLLACGAAEEPPRVQLSVFADASGMTSVESDLGYVIDVKEARMIAEDIVFTVAGEVHTSSFWRDLGDALIPPAFAHPGHFQAGEITGEMPGRFLLEWLPEAGGNVGTATLLAGIYQGANFGCARGDISDGMAADDPLLGHTALLGGTARRGEAEIQFEVIVDSPEAREIVGVPFELEVRAGSRERLGLRLLTADPHEGDTLFDGIDFVRLDADGDGSVLISETAGDAAHVDAYNQFRRTFQTHDHFDVRPSLPAFDEN